MPTVLVITSLTSLTRSNESNGCKTSIPILEKSPMRITCHGLRVVFCRIKKPNGINNDILIMTQLDNLRAVTASR